MRLESFFFDTIKHHGIKGQKWGVRRFQNPDGTLTEVGRKRRQARNNIINNRPYTDDKNDIIRSLSDDDKKKLGASLNEDWIEKDYELDILPNLTKSIVEKYNDVPVSFAELWTNGTRTGQIAIATRAGNEYRGKGYGTKAMKRLNDYINRYGKLTMDEVEWWSRSDNIASRKMAEKFGFEYKHTRKYDTGEYAYYLKKLKND